MRINENDGHRKRRTKNLVRGKEKMGLSGPKTIGKKGPISSKGKPEAGKKSTQKNLKKR